MKMSLKRILAALLLGCTLIPLAACSSGDTGTADTTAEDTAVNDAAEDTTTAETEPERLYPEVPDTDWEGRTFNVLGRRHDDPTRWYYVNAEIFSEGENGETVNDAVFRRNSDIEEKYNVKITQDLQLSPQDYIKTTVAAGDQIHDTPSGMAFIEKYSYLSDLPSPYRMLLISSVSKTLSYIAHLRW